MQGVTLGTQSTREGHQMPGERNRERKERGERTGEDVRQKGREKENAEVWM